MSDQHPDGTTLQSSIPAADLRQFPEYNLFGIFTGVVIGRVYPDESNSRSKLTMEYHVFVQNFRKTLFNVPRLSGIFGYDNGDEDVLTPASKFIKSASGTFDATKPQTMRLSETDGDRVAVGFLNGSFREPVILGAVPRPSNNDVLKNLKANGPRKYRRFAGITESWDDSGNVTISLPTDGVLTFDTASSKQAATMKFAGSDSSEGFLLGKSFRNSHSTWHAKFYDALIAFASSGGSATTAIQIAAAIQVFTQTLQEGLLNFEGTPGGNPDKYVSTIIVGG